MKRYGSLAIHAKEVAIPYDAISEITKSKYSSVAQCDRNSATCDQTLNCQVIKQRCVLQFNSSSELPPQSEV